MTIQAIGEREPVAWQWSDFSGRWYTPPTAVMTVAEQEVMARAKAEDAEGRVRALYAADHIESLERERDAAASGAQNEAIEQVAQWMMQNGFATGHGDTVPNLLWELNWQVAERASKAQARITELEAALAGEREAKRWHGRSHQFLDGYRNASRVAVGWLFRQAMSMRDPDPKPRQILYSAAFQLGQSFKYGGTGIEEAKRIAEAAGATLPASKDKTDGK